MNTEEQALEQAVELELEEEYIPQSVDNDGGSMLEDVIPYEETDYTYENQNVSYDIMDSSNDGFYDDVGYTPSVSIDQMVDIAPHTVVSSGYELEEVVIPNEFNTPDDNQLDDVC